MKKGLFCGFDWAMQTHYFVLKDAAKKLLAQGPVPHTAEGFDAFIQLLNCLSSLMRKPQL